ncbi:signal recognition particle protein, partial [Staphylococcus borealis]
VNVAQSFDDQLDVTGVTLTKLDGDTRGGAALSIRSVTQKPIKFVGMSEKMDGLELFHPERMASRILGMGDVLSLIEKAQQDVDQEKAKDLEQKMRNSTFTLDDFLEQLDQVKNLGPLDDIMKMIPGMNKMKGMDKLNMDEKQIDHIKAIIQSMTPSERENPAVLNVSRKKRIAKGSGRSLQEVNRLMKQFNDMKKMMKQFSGVGRKGKKGKRSQMENMLKGMNLPF